ncbi:MAG TPA: sugar ABC transporter permease [Jatrophihabitans sp.]|uniref:carbohydrate ABC transporter permease n=1 Tax=Jatrophihabitans sp. TaxID=1932789 RepID=UPI002F200561
MDSAVPVSTGSRAPARSRLRRYRAGRDPRSRPHFSEIARWGLFILPALALTGFFILYPALGSLRYSLLDWAGYGPERYVGVDNFTELASDPLAWDAVLHSSLFALVTTVVEVTVGTAIALALDRKVFGHKTFKLLIFLPWILPTAFVALSWANGYDPYFGWVVAITDLFGMEHAWLNDSHAVLFAVAIAPILQSTGFVMIVVMGALGDVSSEIHEAATLDGVSEPQRARHVSLPLVRDAVATMALLQFLWGFTNFDYVYIMTSGGPGTASEVTSTFVYSQAFENARFGYACAAAVVTTVLMGAFAMFYTTLIRPRGISKAG